MVLESKVVETVQISRSMIFLFLNPSAKQNERGVATDLQNTGKDNKLAQRRDGNFPGLVVKSTVRLIQD